MLPKRVHQAPMQERAAPRKSAKQNDMGMVSDPQFLPAFRRTGLTPPATHHAEESAWRTRSRVNGARRMRTPVASNTALATAPATGRIEGSPAPVGGWSG